MAPINFLLIKFQTSPYIISVWWQISNTSVQLLFMLLHKKWHFKKQKQGEGQTQSWFLLRLFLKRILRHRNIWQKWTESLAFQVCFLDCEHHPGACQKCRISGPSQTSCTKSASSQAPQRMPRPDQVWEALGYHQHYDKTQLLVLLSFKSSLQPSSTFRVRLTYSPILPQILLLLRNL